VWCGSAPCRCEGARRGTGGRSASEGFHPKRDFRNLDGQVVDVDTGDAVLNDVGRGGEQGGKVGFGIAHQESYAVKFDRAVTYLLTEITVSTHNNLCRSRATGQMVGPRGRRR
jgi:hypothetical protein